MAGPSANVMVAVTPEAVFFRLSGRATAAESGPFRTAAEELRVQGHRRFVVDLTRCESMDSTFIGVLAGLGRRLQETGPGAARIRLLNLASQVQHQLDNLYVLDQFEVASSGPAASAEYQTVGVAPESKADLCRRMLEAHETLMELNPANIPKFKLVTQFLVEDLKRL